MRATHARMHVGDEPHDDPPPSQPRRRVFEVPEDAALRALRRALARGRLAGGGRRTPEDDARNAAFRTLEELLALLDEMERRVERGERCRLVEREHPREGGRMVIEMVIEPAPRLA